MDHLTRLCTSSKGSETVLTTPSQSPLCSWSMSRCTPAAAAAAEARIALRTAGSDRRYASGPAKKAAVRSSGLREDPGKPLRVRPRAVLRSVPWGVRVGGGRCGN